MTNPVRVALLHRDVGFFPKVHRAVQQERLVVPCGESTGIPEFLKRARLPPEPDVLVLGLPKSAVLSRLSLEALRRRCPRLGILAVIPAPADPAPLLSNGAAGVVYEEEITSPGTLGVALARIGGGRRFLCRESLRCLLECGPALVEPDPLEHLTPKKREVVLHLLQGEKEAVIAGSIGMATSTVRGHILDLCRLFGAESRENLLAHLRDPVGLTQRGLPI